MSKKILVILGHPRKESFNGALTDSYIKGAKRSGAQVRKIELGKLKFDPVLRNGYSKIQKLEPGLIRAQKDIKWADHIVFIYPTWWGAMPSLLKGFIDRILLPGFAYKFITGKTLPEQYLKGKSARLIVTMDSPPWFYWLIGSPGHKMMRTTILRFCGINPVKITSIGSVRKASEEKRKKWLDQVRRLGERL
ncbi:NAD(P)H-dependent oxidoreductase [Nanoarchaeota archaeon]